MYWFPFPSHAPSNFDEFDQLYLASQGKTTVSVAGGLDWEREQLGGGWFVTGMETVFSITCWADIIILHLSSSLNIQIGMCPILSTKY